MIISLTRNSRYIIRLLLHKILSTMFLNQPSKLRKKKIIHRFEPLIWSIINIHLFTFYHRISSLPRMSHIHFIFNVLFEAPLKRKMKNKQPIYYPMWVFIVVIKPPWSITLIKVSQPDIPEVSLSSRFQNCCCWPPFTLPVRQFWFRSTFGMMLLHLLLQLLHEWNQIIKLCF